ncbi:MAG: phosphatase PAP2 family protein [Micromonosporaceae bacterium]|nr:phosphatase PAP2 family protein [Micromonosporaceae bacterium]
MWWQEVAIGLALFGVYSLVAGADGPARVAAARAHGQAIFDLERLLHLDIEPALNIWLVGRPVLRTIANYEYASSYLVAALALLVWAIVRRPAQYRLVRNSFLLLNAVGLVTFALYPVMPPRLLPGLGFVDTVRIGHTWGSWGSPMVEHANKLAAMPSLHIAWAMWVSLVLARLTWARRRTGRSVQLVSGAHVLVTAFVVMATANHYLLDAVGGAVPAWACVAVVWRGRPLWRRYRRAGHRVPAADEFFLHVEAPGAAQHVGGIAMVDNSGGRFSREALAASVRAHLDELPRFTQRLQDRGRWRRPRWVPDEDLDWDWHVPAYDLSLPDGRPGGMTALHELISDLAATPLPRDRPMWRWIAVTGFLPDRAAGVLVVHHVISDGIGTVAQALTMLEPVAPAVGPAPEQAGTRVDWLPTVTRKPGALRRAAGTVVGLAQLATDGTPPLRLPVGGAGRRYATLWLPLAEVRGVARRYGARVSDVVLSVVAGGLRRSLAGPDGAAAGDGTGAGRDGLLRVAVPLMAREPGAAAEGNLTAAVMVDLPLGPLPEPERLAQVSRRTGRRLRTGTRVLASAFVMRSVMRVVPRPVHAWFARTVYGRRFFNGVVSNMPGPRSLLQLTGAPMTGAYPILPLAPGTGFTVGALGWDDGLCLGICVDPATLAGADGLAAEALADAVQAVFNELRQTPGSPPQDGTPEAVDVRSPSGVAAPRLGYHPDQPGRAG